MESDIPSRQVQFGIHDQKGCFEWKTCGIHDQKGCFEWKTHQGRPKQE